MFTNLKPTELGPTAELLLEISIQLHPEVMEAAQTSIEDEHQLKVLRGMFNGISAFNRDCLDNEIDTWMLLKSWAIDPEAHHHEIASWYADQGYRSDLPASDIIENDADNWENSCRALARKLVS